MPDSGDLLPLMIQTITAQNIYGSVTQAMTITLEGGARLRYALDLLSPQQGWSPAELLHYRLRAVNFGGRGEEFGDVCRWLTAARQPAPQQPASLLKSPHTRIYHAPAGEGKSRLLQELCLWAQKEGWKAGFIEVRGLQGVGELVQNAAFDLLLKTLIGNATAPPPRLLFVLDDLDAWPLALTTLHAGLRALPDLHWRIVGLARAASWEEGWLQDLARRDPALTPWPDLSLAQYPHASHGSVQVLRLAPGGRGADRASASGLYSQAVTDFHQIVQGRDAPQPAYSAPSGLGDPAATYLSRFLLLHTVALSAVLGADPTQMQDEHHILTFAVDSELNSLEGLCAPRGIDAQALGLGANSAAEVRPLHTLMGALILGFSPVSPSQQTQLLAVLGCPPPQMGPLLRLMNAAYARAEGEVWHGPFPVLLAQHFVCMLRGPEVAAISGALAVPDCQEFSHPAQGAATLSSLAARTAAPADRARLLAFVGAHLPRLISALPTLILAQPQPLLGVLEQLFWEGRSVPEAQELDRALPLPHRTVLFRPLLERLRGQIAGESDVPDAERARRLAAHALALAQLGRLPEALQRTQQALELYRPLAARSPEQYTPELIGHLNNLGNLLSELGQSQAALEVMQEVVARLRPIVVTQPQATPALALALDNLSNRLGEARRLDEALLASQQSVALYRILVSSAPDHFCPDLARSLGNLGNRLARLGSKKVALEVQREAVGLYRKLNDASPDRFRPELARLLNNLGNRLSTLSRAEEALNATQEAVKLRRELATGQPDVFAPLLADSLNNLGLRHAGMEDWPAAQAAHAEALWTLLPFAWQLPQAHERTLAGMYHRYVHACKQEPVSADSVLLAQLEAFRDRNGNAGLS